MPWYLLAVSSALCFALNILILKAAVVRGIPAAVMLIFLYAVGAICYLVHSIVGGASYKMEPKFLWLLIATGVVSYLGNLLQVWSLKTAPNPGYTAAIVGSNALFVTIAALYLFDSRLSAWKMVGVCLCVAGVAMLAVDGGAGKQSP